MIKLSKRPNNPPLIRLGKTFFKQPDMSSCGTASANSMLCMHGKQPVGNFRKDDGTTPKAINLALKKQKIKAKSTYVPANQIPAKSITFIPEQNHYVSIARVGSKKILVHDSLKNAPEWMDKLKFTKNLASKGKRVWVMATKLAAASANTNPNPSYIERIKAVADTYALGSKDIKPFYEIDPNTLHKLKFKKVVNKSGTNRGHPRGGE